MKRLVLACLAYPLAAIAAPAVQPPACAPAAGSDYPTSARADFVFACMTVNGGTHEALNRCSCSIDVIASILPYKDYAEADTILRMQQAGGYLASEFRLASSKELIRRLRAAEAEGDVRCF